MAMYIYHTDGHPVGFLFGTFVHDLDGNPLGRTFGSRVHRLDGSYVGEFHKDTVVEKPGPPRHSILPTKTPAKQPPPPPVFSRRTIVQYGYPDVFHLLYRTGDDGAYPELAIAAE